eukprot:14630917-Ditylum_brightwellii.AAC.1
MDQINKQKPGYLHRNPMDAQLTEEELTHTLRENNKEFEELLGRMTKYNANIIGSNSYFCRKRLELEALMEQEGLPTIWSAFRLADNHWLDLIQLFYRNNNLPQFGDGNEFAKWRRKLI